MYEALFINITSQSIVILGAGVTSAVIGALIYTRDRSRGEGRSFLFLASSVAAWAVALSMFESVRSGSLERVFLWATYLSAVFIPFALLLFSLAVSSGERKKFTKTSMFAALVPLVFVVFLLSLPGVILDSVKSVDGWAKEIVFGPGLIILNSYFVLSIFASFVVLIRRYTKSAGVFKMELRYILWSISAAVFLMLFANLLLPTAGFYDLSWLGPIVGACTLAVIGYLIVKYNFWNIKLVATELFVSLISLTLLLEIFLSRSLADLAIKAVILALVAFSSFFLVKSVKHEIESREEMEKLAKDLAGINDDLHELDKQKSEFVANSAHHLRDPLTAIKGYASMALEGSFGELSEETREAIDRIFKSSQRLVVIINDFMDISKIESGKMDYTFTRVDLKKMVKDLVMEMSPAARDTGLQFGFEIDDTKEYCANADEGKIRQVVSNLLDNSIKYTPHGTVGISLANEGGGNILLSVFDTGIGMKPETVGKIFHKFSRAEEASKFHTGGSGLGLYVASEILKKHNGRIWAESPGLGKGSAFYLELQEA